MAFDLVQYFNDQLIFQKPLLLNNYDRELRDKYILEINTLTLGKLVTLWRDNDEIQFATSIAKKAPTLDMIGLDIARTTDGKLFLMEVNRSPGFGAFEMLTGDNLADILYK